MKKNFWKNKKVMITGGNGFLGRHVVSRLKKLGAKCFVPDIPEFNLTRQKDVNRLFEKFTPQVVIHLAVHGGGIGYMKEHPGSVFCDNILMNTLMVEASRKMGVEKFLGIGTVCSYPKFTPTPFKESFLWNGYPEETNAPYGLAKKMMLVQTQGYAQEYNFCGIHLLLANMYGPGDNFNPKSSHVIPALIRKMLANKDEIVVWGTGKASREFLYVDDAAVGILKAAEKYHKPEPINLGTGGEITIKKLVTLIARVTNFKGKIIWDKSKPDGQPKRRLNIQKSKKEFGFKAVTSFEQGLRKTVAWYKKNHVKK